MCQGRCRDCAGLHGMVERDVRGGEVAADPGVLRGQPQREVAVVGRAVLGPLAHPGQARGRARRTRGRRPARPPAACATGSRGPAPTARGSARPDSRAAPAARAGPGPRAAAGSRRRRTPRPPGPGTRWKTLVGKALGGNPARKAASAKPASSSDPAGAVRPCSARASWRCATATAPKKVISRTGVECEGRLDVGVVLVDGGGRFEPAEHDRVPRPGGHLELAAVHQALAGAAEPVDRVLDRIGPDLQLHGVAVAGERGERLVVALLADPDHVAGRSAHRPGSDRSSAAASCRVR